MSSCALCKAAESATTILRLWLWAWWPSKFLKTNINISPMTLLLGVSPLVFQIPAATFATLGATRPREAYRTRHCMTRNRRGFLFSFFFIQLLNAMLRSSKSRINRENCDIIIWASAQVKLILETSSTYWEHSDIPNLKPSLRRGLGMITWFSPISF